jgi:hypothetical protein
MFQKKIPMMFDSTSRRIRASLARSAMVRCATRASSSSLARGERGARLALAARGS